MITLLQTHPLLFLGGLGVVWLLFLFPAALPLLGRVLERLVTTERGRALLMLAIVAGLVWWFRSVAGPVRYADGRAAGVAAERAAWEAKELKRERDMVAAAFRISQATLAASDDARAANDRRTSNLNDGLARAEGYAREPRAPVPAVCPEPDARLVRDLQAGHGRLEALEGRLRDLRGAGDRKAGDPARE